ncbi:hypothetical protein PVX_113250 [Plasmodium vivax]|uniref:Uncharacterized protein n=2 Tax=Plasmodium vivax TaxID=5855 RepID=A5K1L5_PLAVS|nr:hypothetical protein PVX_113250 [Plasmodium vivax]EDL46315.1 hypothetical protein PVX_113250 [Plasmodium vivax]KMZ91995.1 hypothetical protein PVMG_05481 [Plasmodium vivax Mauritania I]|eukprot:XP_001616042.1 hypothetical protein [Plasmodium vivax Sal-1]
MVDNKNNCSGGSHGFSNGSAGSLNKVNTFLKVFVFTLVILAIQCFNESISASVQKSSGNGAIVASRLLKDDFNDSTGTLAIFEEDGSSENLSVDGSESQLDEFGSAGNLSLCSTLDGEVQVPEEDVPEKKRKSSKENVHVHKLMGETTMADMEYEENFMKECRNEKRKGKFHKRVLRFLKKHHYTLPAVLAIILGITIGKEVAIGVIVVYVVLLVLRFVHKKYV